MIGYRNYRQHGLDHSLSKVISQSSRSTGLNYPSEPPGKNRVHFDGGQPRNNQTALRLPEKWLRPDRIRLRLIQLGEGTRIDEK